uniref:short coiled-coil protein A-like isoform X1 n=1 Tax=Pristiophorus japonicus TaxID=55135 RepID=UPI00398F30A9
MPWVCVCWPAFAFLFVRLSLWWPSCSCQSSEIFRFLNLYRLDILFCTPFPPIRTRIRQYLVPGARCPEVDSGSSVSGSKLDRELFTMNTDMEVIDPENQVELEEKTRLINQVLELQHTLEELSARVDAVKEENLKLKSENQVLGQYIENLMSASSVFQTTDTKSKRK